MNVVHKLRANHTELLNKEIVDTYKIYTPHWNDAVKEVDFLNTLLKGVDGTITLTADDNSWFDHYITVEYNGYTFDVRKSYKGVFNAHAPSMNRLIEKVPHSTVYGVEPLKNYTFDKLTTAKVLKVFEWKIAYYEWIKIQSSVNIELNVNRLNDGVAMLKRIADAIQTEVRHTSDHSSDDYSVYTPLGTAIVSHNKYKEYVDINSVTYDIIEFLDMMNK